MHATPGREGELIFRYIVQHTSSTKPIKRLWLQSMTPQAIRDGFAQLRDDQSMRSAGRRGGLPVRIRLAGGD